MQGDKHVLGSYRVFSQVLGDLPPDCDRSFNREQAPRCVRGQPREKFQLRRQEKARVTAHDRDGLLVFGVGIFARVLDEVLAILVARRARDV